jgi:hypothetical protein
MWLHDNFPIRTAHMMHVSLVVGAFHMRSWQVGAATLVDLFFLVPPFEYQSRYLGVKTLGLAFNGCNLQ